ncbi:MAG: DUF4837 family protein [Prevotellaceae bacterium]|nr:DUF4837 family protein [Prevotellaceae bacterium]
MKALLLTLIASVTLLSCSDGQQSLLPKSGGRPYEVLVVSENESVREMIDSVLSQDVAGLPQSEPCFDISKANESQFTNSARLARSIVIVTIDAQQFTQTRIRYEKNVWAKPQIIVYINTPSASRLETDMGKLGNKLASLLTRAEINNAISSLASSRNPKADSMVKRLTGMDMRIPTDMKSSKKGNGFLWFSNNAKSGMQSICIYTYPGNSLDASRAMAARDSVMRINIPGEEKGMYMTTAHECVNSGFEREHGKTIMVTRGLWEMRNDAMGGPFVSHSMVDSANNRIIVAEAFVYAPEMKKRNLTRQIEAALYTLTETKASK